jgi:anti-sigma factor RsiW
MNCVDWEERIALYAGGDLPPAGVQAVERHVAECAGCQTLLNGLRQSLALVREVHREPVEEAHFAAVRARVLAELGAPARRWGFAWGFAIAAAALVLSIAMWPRPVRKTVTQALVPAPIVHDGGADTQAPGPPVLRPARARRRAGPGGPARTRGSAPPQPAEPMVVKLITNDPDVVIYWITSTKGE